MTVKLAVKAGADVLVIDGMEGATGRVTGCAARPHGRATMSALCDAVRAPKT